MLSGPQFIKNTLNYQNLMFQKLNQTEGGGNSKHLATRCASFVLNIEIYTRLAPTEGLNYIGGFFFLTIISSCQPHCVS